jgi:hypothetical protein
MEMSVIEWLLDSDPSIRWQVMRDLIAESDATVARERSRVAAEGWGLACWTFKDRMAIGAARRSSRAPGSPPRTRSSCCEISAWIRRTIGVRRAIDQVRDRCTWGAEFGDSPFFEGEVEPCINGRVLAIGAYFGEASDRLADRLLQEQLSDGGWNCDAPPSQRSSFHTTICVLEGLLGYETAKGPRPDVTAARVRGQEYLLERRLFRSRTTGRSIARDKKTGRSRRGPPYRFPRAGTTTSCGDWTTCGAPALDRTSAPPRRSTWCGRSATKTGVGRLRIRIRVRLTSRWKAARASRAAGTPFERFACCAGRVPPDAPDFLTPRRPALARLDRAGH